MVVTHTTADRVNPRAALFDAARQRYQRWDEWFAHCVTTRREVVCAGLHLDPLGIVILKREAGLKLCCLLVKPSERGIGIGASLLAAALARPARTHWLSIEADHPDIDWLARRGFRATGDVVHDTGSLSGAPEQVYAHTS